MNFSVRCHSDLPFNIINNEMQGFFRNKFQGGGQINASRIGGEGGGRDLELKYTN